MPFATPRFLPGASSLRSHLSLARFTTLHTAMRGTGTTVQAVTLSSSTTLAICANIEVEITGTGTNTTATARWRINGGAWTVFTLAASVALTGWPFTLGFPAGIYTNGDAYRSVVGTEKDDLGNVWDGSSAAANVRPYLGAVNGFPSLRTDGVGTFVRTTTNTLSTALVGGIRTPFTIFVVARYNGTLAPAASAPLFALCDGSAGNAGFFYFAVSPAGKWRLAKRGDSGGTTIVDTAGAGSQNVADNNLHVFEIFQSGTAVSLLVDGVATSINASTQNIGTTVTAQFFDIGQLSTQGQVPDLYGDVDWLTHDAYTGVQSATIRTLARQNLKQAFGL
jgi:hypothetical protein